MAYTDSVAYRLDEAQRIYTADQPILVTLEGGRSARSREGVSSTLMRMAVYAIAVMLSVFVFGSMSIALTSGTVAMLQQNEAMSSQIKEVRATNDDLRVECSILSRGERVSMIATQNLGMVYANTAEHMDLG